MPTTIDVTDQYPSTDDMPPIMGAQDDPVLLILENALKRYKRGGTATAYQEVGGFVCAIGALGAAAGIKAKEWTGRETAIDYKVFLNQKIDDAAKEAIKLVNRAARKLYPESMEYRNRHWSWPLEYLNQNMAFSFKERKQQVIACYQYAIEQRRSGKW